MGAWREAQKHDIFLLDVTAKSGMLCFAPTFENVMRYKRGELTDEEYTLRYELKMRESRIHFPLRWSSFANHPKTALACYCAPGRFCHRHLLAPMIQEFMQYRGVVVHLRGELTKTTTNI